MTKISWRAGTEGIFIFKSRSRLKKDQISNFELSQSKKKYLSGYRYR